MHRESAEDMNDDIRYACAKYYNLLIDHRQERQMCNNSISFAAFVVLFEAVLRAV